MQRIWKFGVNVDTDQMVPGRYAPYMRPGKPVGEVAFIEARPDFCREAVAGDIIVAGDNFGCGSSREYAPLALKERGVAAIIAPSFARIFFRNGINLGIPLLVSAEAHQAINDGELGSVDLEAGTLTVGERCFALSPLPPFAQAIVAAGGVVPYVRAHGDLPREVAGGSAANA